MPGTDVSCCGLEEHGFVEAAPDVLGGVDEVLDPASHAVDPGTRWVARGRDGGDVGDGVVFGERGNGRVDGGEVGGDRLGGALHEDDGVGGVNEVPVTGSDEETELFLLLVDEISGGGFHISDLRDGFGSEEGFGVPVSSAGEGGLARVIGGHRRYSHCRCGLNVFLVQIKKKAGIFITSNT